MSLLQGDLPYKGTLMLSVMGWPQIALGLFICTVAIWNAERRARAKLREDAAKKASEDDVGTFSSPHDSETSLGATPGEGGNLAPGSAPSGAAAANNAASNAEPPGKGNTHTL